MSDSFPSPETIHRVELPNGIVVLAYENPTSPAVVVAGSVWAGAIGEPPAQAGLARFTASMLMRGTERRAFAQINEELESVGASLGLHAGVHTAGFGGKSLTADLDLLLDVLADVLRHPAFPPAEVDTLQGQILTDLERRQHDTRRMARLAFDELLYPDHAYGRSVSGYLETVRGLGRDDLAGFYRDHYTPRGMIVALVGAVTTVDAVARVGAALGDWQAPQATAEMAVPPQVELGERRARHVPVPGKTQADVIVGWPGMTRNDPDHMAGTLANTVLGVFGMMGRLGDTVRDQQGLAYYVYSRLEAGLGAGPWLANAGVDPANVERAVEGIVAQVRRLRDEPVPADELADSQAYLAGSMPLRLETNEGVAGAILEMERYGLGLDYLQRYADLVRAVTPEQVRDVARGYLDPDTYVLATAGPGG
ncbi:MAG TPA: pitrilysin family protein [Anaerolineae bacterium]|nr:pitrilysin family protein [Anaerolineae bacterium]